MADDRPASEVASVMRCPWCSATLTSTAEATCPSCGATLAAESEPQLPGVTTVGPVSIARPAQRKPNRIVQWITGDTSEAVEPLSVPAPGSLTPPAADVRVEMLRIELAAQLADRSAEIEALETEARLEAGADADSTSGGRADAAVTDGREPAAVPEEGGDVAPGAASRASTWAELEAARAAGSGAGDAPNEDAPTQANARAGSGTNDAGAETSASEHGPDTSPASGTRG